VRHDAGEWDIVPRIFIATIIYFAELRVFDLNDNENPGIVWTLRALALVLVFLLALLPKIPAVKRVADRLDRLRIISQDELDDIKTDRDRAALALARAQDELDKIKRWALAKQQDQPADPDRTCQHCGLVVPRRTGMHRNASDCIEALRDALADLTD